MLCAMAMAIGILGVEAIHAGTWNAGDNGEDGSCGNDYIIGPDLGNNGHKHQSQNTFVSNSRSTIH